MRSILPDNWIFSICSQLIALKLILNIVQPDINNKQVQSQAYHQKMNKASKPTKMPKKDRYGRWSPAEANLFQELIQRYGKNWKKIHEHMKGRTLSQIRSHAQKFFDKVGPKKVQEYERRAKLLEALETLEKEKRLSKSEEPSSAFQEINHQEDIVEEIREAQSSLPARQEQSLTSLHGQLKEPSPLGQIKAEEESSNKRNEEGGYPGVSYLGPPMASQNGFLISLIYTNPDAFSHYGLGLEHFCTQPGIQHPFYFQGR